MDQAQQYLKIIIGLKAIIKRNLMIQDIMDVFQKISYLEKSYLLSPYDVIYHLFLWQSPFSQQKIRLINISSYVLIMISRVSKFLPLHSRSVRSNTLTIHPRFRFSDKDERFVQGVECSFDSQILTPTISIRSHFSSDLWSQQYGILAANQMVGLPWWAVLIASSMFVRMTIFPLILVQMKRVSRIGPVSPVFVFLKDAWKYSQAKSLQKLKKSIKIYNDLCKQENFRLSTVFVYNLAYYPLLVSMIFGIRKLLGCPQLSGATFLHISNFTDIDPYFILPTLTIGLYYFNFQRFITPENEKTLITKIRRACQIFLILWYPFLCSWPSGIVLYMCSNAFVSVLQSTVMTSPWFVNKMNQKIVLYNSILHSVEYDKGTSESIIEAIHKGEQNYGSLAITQDVLEKQTEEMLKKLDQQENEPLKDDDGFDVIKDEKK